MITVGQILSEKGNSVWSVSPETYVVDALKEMAARDVGALLVMDHERLLGIVSERDHARKVGAAGRSPSETSVKEIMSTDLVTVHPPQAIGQCMTLMTERHVRHLPVLETGRVVGVISIGDVVKAVISEQEETIRQLEKYIHGIP
jgi:CBS domain-containing protein